MSALPHVVSIAGRYRRNVAWAWVSKVAPGLVLAGTLALLAVELGKAAWFQSSGISPLTLAIVFGIIVGNTAYPRVAAASAAGITFSKQTLLRAGIIFYGLRLTFQDITNVGIGGVVIDLLMLSSTFALSCWAGTRLFGLDRKTAMLIGAGSSICGAAAVMAAEPVVRGRTEQVTVAVATVVVFGTVAIFLYPALYHLNQRYALLPLSPTAYGIFVGSTIHEVAQVVAAGRAITDAAGDTAVITKMVRVMMLAPFLVILSTYLTRFPQKMQGGANYETPAGRHIMVPWFALWFVVVAALHSLIALPKAWVNTAIGIDTFVLAMAMAALGVSTRVAAIRTAGIKPLMLAALLFAWLIFGGFAINAGVSALLAAA